MKVKKIIQGDCLYILDKEIKDYKKIIFVSDPPFNINIKYNTYKDNLPEDSYYEWLGKIFGTNKQVIIHYPEALYKYSFQIKTFPERVVSWVYNSNTARQHRDIAFFNVKPDFRKVGQPYKNTNDKRIKKKNSRRKDRKII
jgi:hypothetical protein